METQSPLVCGIQQLRAQKQAHCVLDTHKVNFVKMRMLLIYNKESLAQTSDYINPGEISLSKPGINRKVLLTLQCYMQPFCQAGSC